MTATVVVVGAGPAGLTAATELRARGIDRVVVLEREQQAGGAPRHTDHLGFGVRDLHRLLRGPSYAAVLRRRALDAGVEIRTGSTAIEVRTGAVTLADGSTVAGDAILLATGVRERPRAARLVPGDRPRGVYTTGAIQHLTALHHRQVGRRAVIVGAEHVSFSAIWTLRHGGCETVAMVTPLPRHQSVAPLRWATAGRYRVPILTGVDVASIEGRGRVAAVVLSDGRRIDCDTVVFTGDWIPDNELAVRAGLIMTPGARGPAVSARSATSMTGVFAAGNLVHPADAADVCALDGRLAADAISSYLVERAWPAAVTAIAVDDGLAWAAFTAAGITVRTDDRAPGAARQRVEVRRGGEVVATSRRRRLRAGRLVTVRVDPQQRCHTDAGSARWSVGLR